jgi:hypothetical protein
MPRPRAGPDDMPAVDDFSYDDAPIYFDHRQDDGESKRHARKRENQANRWLGTVLPLLVPIYIELVHKTDNLRNLDDVVLDEPPCSCTADELSGRGAVKRLKILVLRWTGKC